MGIGGAQKEYAAALKCLEGDFARLCPETVKYSAVTIWGSIKERLFTIDELVSSDDVIFNGYHGLFHKRCSLPKRRP